MIGIALVNLRGYLRRLVPLLVLVALGTASVLVATAITDTARRTAHDEIAEGEGLRMIVLDPLGDRPGARTLTPAALEEVRSTPGVDDVQPALQTSIGLAQEGLPAVILYATTHRPALTPPLLEQVRADVFPLRAGEILLPQTAEGQDLSAALGKEVTVDVTVRSGSGQGQQEPRTVRVVGLYDDAWQVDGPSAAYADDASVAEWAGGRAGVEGSSVAAAEGYREVTVLVDRADRTDAVTRELQEQGFVATSMAQRLAALPQSIQLIQYAGWAVLAVIMVVAVVAAGSLAQSLVQQRIREIGLLKALGYRRRDVFSQMLVEMGVAGGAAAVVGVVLGIATSLVLGEFLSTRESFSSILGGDLVRPALGPGLLLVLLPFLALLAAALRPAMRAARVSPVQALGEWR